MKVYLTIVVLIFSCYALLAQDTFIPFEKNAPKSEQMTTDFNEYMNAMNSLVDFSGGIKIYQKGQVKFDYYRGVESKSSGVKISETSRFPIASLTKPFTAMMVLRLAEQGRIVRTLLRKHKIIT